MEKEKKVIENVSEADQDKVKIAIGRWNNYLFSKDSDKNLFEYFLESTKKANILPQYSTVFLENCIVWAVNKLETTPMHHNMRLKQSFQFLVDNTIEFNPTEEILHQLCEKSIGFKRTKSISLNNYSDEYNYFSQLSSLFKYQSSKDNEMIKFIFEKVLEKCSLEKVLQYYDKVDENLLEKIGPVFAKSLLQKIETNPSLSDDIIVYIYDMKNNDKKLVLIDNLVFSPKMNESELLTECWSIYSDKDKEKVIAHSLMLDSQNPVLESLSGYKQYVKNTIESDLDYQQIIRNSQTMKNKKKIELYFSVLEELYEQTEIPKKMDTIQNYAREMYIRIIGQKRPDLTKGLISIKAKKSIIQTEDVPLFVYQVMQTFPKVMAYHLVIELLGSVKKAGKINEFSDVFNTSKIFEVGSHKFQFEEEMKNEIKYIYHEYLTEKFKEEKKHIVNKPVKRLKI